MFLLNFFFYIFISTKQYEPLQEPLQEQEQEQEQEQAPQPYCYCYHHHNSSRSTNFFNRIIVHTAFTAFQNAIDDEKKIIIYFIAATTFIQKLINQSINQLIK